MKKLISILLCLMLCLPVMGLAETRVVAPGPITMELQENDLYEVSAVKDNEPFAFIYPGYDETADLVANFNVVWSSEDITPALDDLGVETYGNLIKDQNLVAFQEMGIEAETYELLSATYEDGTVTLYTYMVLDYSGMGYPIKVEMYQLQLQLILASDSIYTFTFSAATPEEIETMLPYLDTVVMK